jgi:multidrug efflux pump
MILSDTAIRRPVFASVLSVAIVLFGAIGFTRLSVREFPDVDPPVVSVNTVLRGANPRVMESAVTDILEEELSTIPGLRTLTSSSAEQSSNITLEFTLDREDRGRGAGRARQGEPGARPAAAGHRGAGGEQAGRRRPALHVAVAVEPQLRPAPALRHRRPRGQDAAPEPAGVGRAQIAGERRFSMRIWLSSSALASRGLTVQDVINVIRSRNVEIPAGRIESERREFTVRALGELKTPDEFANLVVQSRDGQVVKLRDLARVELGPADDRSALRFSGEPAVAIGVVRQSKANIIEISDAVRAEVAIIAELLPPGVTLTVGFDQSLFVRRSIQEAQETLLIAGVLVVLIIFFFLRNVRATIIPALAIPVSVVGAFGVLFALGFSVNNLTLLALILAIGIVVDDAIIVMENAYRHQEEMGEDPERAAMRGTSEIAFAVIATTIALVAVFTPLAFLRGTTGRLFNEFAIALAGAVVISSFVALTLTPMLSAKILKVPKSHGPLFNFFENAYLRSADLYQRTLAAALRGRWLVLGGGIATVLLAVFVFTEAQAGVRAAGGPRLLHRDHGGPRRRHARLHRRLPAPDRGRARPDAGHLELLQHRRVRRAGERRHLVRAAHRLERA